MQWSCNPFQKNAEHKLKKINVRTLLPTAKHLKTGDLIVRHGKGIISESFMFMSQKQRKYSHAGMILLEGDSVYVIHALGGETAADNAVKKHTLYEFCDPADNHSFAVYRYIDMDSTTLQNYVNNMIDAYRKRILFDMDFRMDTDSVQYCSELVWKSIMRAVKKPDYLDYSKTPDGHIYVAVDNLYYNSHTKLIYQADYDF
ncbi:MAG: YiiX/YebB-like N1pC/P60 family cysteine hydrolase [Bacteroidia bacterium]|nr:YiiX/YebB-like N1pC/P60 family cysteine hydrolase [Bacteroidia bacterium]